MKVDARQIIDRDLLARTTGASGSQTDTMFTALNSEITPPLAFSVTGANRIVTIGNITVFNPSTNLNRTVPPISQLLPAFASGTVTLDATGAGNATPSVGTTLALAMVASRFMRIGVSIDAIGSLSLTKGTQGATLATATTPAVPSGLFGIGHIVVRTDASNNVANVLTSDIYQYMGGGGGTSGDANSILETLKNELVDSSYQNVTPSIAAQQAATLVSSFSGTGSYGVADQTYLFPAIADSLTSVQMLDEQEFIGNNPTDISKSLAFLSWRSSYIDPLATVQISRNAGTNYYPVTMSRVGANTETFSGEYEWTREEEAADALDSFSTNNTQTELTNVAGVTESVSSLFTLAVNQGVQLRIKNISVKLSRLGTLVGNYRFAIFNSSSSLPSARLFTGAWQTASTVSTSAVDISLSTDLNNVYIDDNTPYHVVIETDDTYKAGFSTGVNALRVHRSTASGSGASTLDGATWTAVAASQVNRIITYAAELFTSLDTDVTATTDEDQLNAFSSIANDSAFYTNLGTGFNNTVTAFAIQTDGKILVCGSFTTLNDITRNRLVRLNSDGTVDTTFYTNLGTGFNNGIQAIAVQTDGKILVGGQFTTFNGITRNRLVRLNSDGTHDAAFYTNLGTGFDNDIRVIAIQTDGKILVGGYFTTLNGNTRNRLVRLNSDGTHDAAFYTNLGTGFDNHVTNVVLQTDGKILVGGWFTALNAITRNRLVRLNSDGTHDAAFYTNLGSAFGNNWTVAITVQTDGKILVGGEFLALNGITRMRLVRLGPVNYSQIGSQFTVATGTAYAVKKAMLRLKRTGTVSGNIFYKIVRDSAGVPSALSSDVVAVSNLVAASTISTSNVDTSIRFGTSVIGPGTYHIVLASDATYIASFSAGVNYIGIQRYTGAASSLSALFDGTAWYEHTSTFRYAYTLSGRPVDLRIKITSGTVLTQLAAFAAFYEIGTPIAGGRKNFDKKFFKSQADNLSSFSINFVPDPDLLRVYRIGTGQVFKYPDFTFSGSTITFPTNTFYDSSNKDVELHFVQTEGSSFDNSDRNGLLLASNFLGSTDSSIDRSMAGRGIFLRRPDGTLREIGLDDSDNIIVYSI